MLTKTNLQLPAMCSIQSKLLYFGTTVVLLTFLNEDGSTCNVITATDVENPASARLLENLGAQLVSTSDHSTSWEIRKLLS